MLEELLKRVGLKFEDLSKAERETLFTWNETLQKNLLTVETLREYIHAMRDAVEQELTNTEHNTRQDIYLKARLRNYLLLEAFLSTPEKAKAAIERAIAGLASHKRG